MDNQIQHIIDLAISHWNLQIIRANKLFDQLTDEQLYNEVSPNRNRGIYLLGHLTAVHDRMLPLLNFEQQIFPELEKAFIENPDKAFAELPNLDELRQNWKTVNDTLEQHFVNLKPHEWLEKHNAVSEEDFIKEPNRNRINILMVRASHVAYHLGQIAFLKK